MLEKPKISITYRSITVQLKKIDHLRSVALIYIPPYGSERWVPMDEIIIENALFISPN